MGRLTGFVLGVVYCFTAMVARADVKPMHEGVESFLKNGGFEETTQVPGIPKTGGEHNGWMLEGGPHVPAEGALSSHFTGKVSMVSEGAPEGKRFVRLSAGSEREAHIHQACLGLKPGSYYMFSLKYRGGPVTIKTYVYKDKGKGKGKAPQLQTVAEGGGGNGTRR